MLLERAADKTYALFAIIAASKTLSQRDAAPTTASKDTSHAD